MKFLFLCLLSDAAGRCDVLLRFHIRLRLAGFSKASEVLHTNAKMQIYPSSSCQPRAVGQLSQK